MTFGRRDLSDTSSLMNIKDNSKIIQKYSSKRKLGELKTIDNDTQKYREYLTKSKPILDEANYVSLREQDKNLENEKKIFEYIQNLKDKRNKQANLTPINEVKKSVIDQDITPTIQTQMDFIKFDEPALKAPVKTRKEFEGDLLGLEAEVKKDTTKEKKKREIGIDIGGLIAGELKENKKRQETNKIFDDTIKEEAIKKIQALAKQKLASKKLAETKEATEKIKSAIKTKTAMSDIEKQEKAASKIQSVYNKSIFRDNLRLARIEKDYDDAISKATTVAEKEELTEKKKAGRPRKPRNPVGRPVGSKNKPKP
jgi:anion-transporting  ArsA/GET3 family ATPase